MKKSLVLAMAMALGVTASAYAANPFSDVPAGHWAYDSIDKLAAAGVIDGMGDGTFQGDKTMTRYEMAQIVAKAMAKGANVDKLAAEFADELDALGVRVANLEKKADNVKITGNITMIYRGQHGDVKSADTNAKEYTRLRSDISLKGQINEDWSYNALLRNDQVLSGTDKGKGEETVKFQRAWVDGKIGGVKVKAGRHNKKFGNGEVYSDRLDGVEASYGKKVNVLLGYAQLANDAGVGTISDANYQYGMDAKVAYAEVKAALGHVLDVEADYYGFQDVVDAGKYTAIDKDGDFSVFGLTANWKMTDSLKLTGSYFHSTADAEKTSTLEEADSNGWSVKLAYKGANAAKPGSWGAYAKYLDLPRSVMVGSDYTTSQDWVKLATGGGVKGTIVGANYTFAKNIIGTVEYSHGESKEIKAEDKNYDTIYAGLSFTF